MSKSKDKFYMSSLGLSKVIYDKKKGKYVLENFKTVQINEKLVFDSAEDAIINNYFNRVNLLNKEEANLNRRLYKIKKDKEKLKSELKISEIKEKFPEKFLVK